MHAEEVGILKSCSNSMRRNKSAGKISAAGVSFTEGALFTQASKHLSHNAVREGYIIIDGLQHVTVIGTIWPDIESYYHIQLFPAITFQTPGLFMHCL